MPHDKEKEKPLEKIHEVRLGDIEVSKDNVRLSDATKDLEQLAASIERHGLIQPVVLIGEPGKPPYKLIAGLRRFLAHGQILKRTNIRAVFAGKTLSKTEAVIRSLVENLQRLDLEYGDTAKAVTFLYEKLGRDDKKVKKETGLSLQKIRDFILIEARATPKMKEDLQLRRVTPVDVKRAIRAAQDDLGKAEQLVDLIIKYQPNAHQKKRIVLYGEKEKKASAQKIFEEALKPQVEQNIIVSLPEDIRKGLTKATQSLMMEPEELAAKVLSDWLRDQGFI